MACMSDESNQILIPDSFTALFIPPGRLRPTATREHIAQRYELCEDMAQMLTETAQSRLFELGITEADVLERIQRGLTQTGSAFGPDEAQWVTRRLAELLGWTPEAPPGREGRGDREGRDAWATREARGNRQSRGLQDDTDDHS
jgi:hypothetical protein